MMDNRVFNVNGSGLEDLIDTLKLCFKQEGVKAVDPWYVNKDKGLSLQWHRNGEGIAFPASMGPEFIAPMVLSWIESDEAQSIKLEDWDINADHDGSNSLGWRVYVEDWGHVGGDNYAICAITPAYMWHGK